MKNGLLVCLPTEPNAQGDSSSFKRTEQITYITDTLFLLHDCDRIWRHFFAVKTCYLSEIFFAFLLFTSGY